MAERQPTRPGVDGVRHTQQQRRELARSRVITAATALIAARGSRAVSLADVGRLAGYSSGIVSHHFGSKQQLLAAVVENAQQFEVPQVEGCGLDQLRQLVTTYLENLHDRAPAGQAFLQLWSEAVAGEALLGDLFARRDGWFRALLSDYIRAGIEDESIRVDVDAEATAVVLTGLLRGIAIQLMSASTDLPDNQTIATAAARVLLSGLSQKSG